MTRPLKVLQIINGAVRHEEFMRMTPSYS